MRSKLSALASLVAVALLCAPGSALLVPSASARNAPSNASQSQIQALADSPLQVSAIVELESESVVERQMLAESVLRKEPALQLDSIDARSYEAQLEAEQESFKARAELLSRGLQIRTQLRRLANAVSIEAPGKDIAQIAALPGVRSVRLTKEYRATLDASVPLINAPAVWEKLGGANVAGDGVRIAILDTGIDISNPLFSDAGFTAPAGFPRGNAAFTNNKVIVAKAFINESNPTPQDENGHGTNVAGIAAGDFNTVSPLGLLSGVAPRAYLGNYRVLRKTGSGTDDMIARALEEAVSDGFQIANLSLGSAAGDDLSFLDQAVERAVAAGMIVVVAAGNAGDNGEMSIASPGVAPSAITVAATSNSHIVGPVISVTAPAPVDAALQTIGSVKGAGGPALNDAFGPLPYVVVQGRACGSLLAGSLAGKIALIERGDCTFVDKINAAKNAGATAVIVYNQDKSESATGGDNLINMSVTGTMIPSVFVTRRHGLALREWANANPGAQISVTPFGSGDAAADVIAAFSSRGPTTLATLKPDVSAPGQIIYSGAIKTDNPDGVSDPSGFVAVSGTSQAAPHVAGAAALIKQLNPTWTAEQVKSALISSASQAVFGDADRTASAGLLAAGAGRIDLKVASEVGATFSPASLSFGINKLKKKPKPVKVSLNITSHLDGSNNFTLSAQQLDPGNRVTVELSETAISLARGASAAVNMTISAAKPAEKRDYTGFVLVTGPSGQTLRVPYWVRYRK